MSHLSHIKTSITNTQILKKTLDDLEFTYENEKMSYTTKKDIIVKKNGTQIFNLGWNGKAYTLIADLQFWHLNITSQKLLDKITQQYSYNSIIEESKKHGFNQINTKKLLNGSLKIALQRWN
uniref:Uncharacterized protein ycf35 n=1 Tax=Dicranema revolutum TaxID=239144 RepID=A0A4D6WXF6_9FLOR|nr:hypothetical protein [Dicranema revolutum]